MDAKDIQIENLAAENRMLRETIKRLEEEIARLKKDSSNSSKPPSSDVIKPPRLLSPGKGKRRRGGQPGHRKFVRRPFSPDQVDKVVEYELDPSQRNGLEPLKEWHVVQQVELPKKKFHVIEHRARKYRDRKTGRIVIAPMPAVVRKGGLLGPQMTALLAFLKSGCHCSFGTIQRYCREVLGLDLSRGMLSKTIQKASKALKQPYERLRDRLPQEPYVGVDETGHHDKGKLRWTWCAQTAAYSLFHIAPSRGSKILRKLLGRRFAGVLHCDYYSAYRKYARLYHAQIQYCLAHLIRDIRFLAEHPMNTLAHWGQSLLKPMKTLFKTLHNQREISLEQRLRRLQRIQETFLQQVHRPPNHKLAKKLARRFQNNREADYFRFVTDPNVEPTNNATERAIRHVVIDRNVTQGTRGDAGMRWCERSWTILATCQKQHRNVLEYLHQSLRAHWMSQPAPTLC